MRLPFFVAVYCSPVQCRRHFFLPTPVGASLSLTVGLVLSRPCVCVCMYTYAEGERGGEWDGRDFRICLLEHCPLPLGPNCPFSSSLAAAAHCFQQSRFCLLFLLPHLRCLPRLEKEEGEKGRGGGDGCKNFKAEGGRPPIHSGSSFVVFEKEEEARVCCWLLQSCFLDVAACLFALLLLFPLSLSLSPLPPCLSIHAPTRGRSCHQKKNLASLLFSPAKWEKNPLFISLLFLLDAAVPRPQFSISPPLRPRGLSCVGRQLSNPAKHTFFLERL